MSASRRGWPVWVRVGLWRVPSRQKAVVNFWGFLIAASVMVVLGATSNPASVFGAVLYLPAVWYGLAVRWVDRNAGWSNAPPLVEDDDRW